MSLLDKIASGIAELLAGLLAVAVAVLAFRATGLYMASLLTESGSSSYIVAAASIFTIPAIVMACTWHGASVMANDIKARLQPDSKKGAE